MNPRPVYEDKDGKITVAVWKNKSKFTDKPIYSVSIQKNYRTQEGNWETAQSYNKQDLHKIVYLINKAYDWINYVEQEGSKDETKDRT